MKIARVTSRYFHGKSQIITEHGCRQQNKILTPMLLLPLKRWKQKHGRQEGFSSFTPNHFKCYGREVTYSFITPCVLQTNGRKLCFLTFKPTFSMPFGCEEHSILLTPCINQIMRVSAEMFIHYAQILIFSRVSAATCLHYAQIKNFFRASVPSHTLHAQETL